ncbi:MAG TPA: crystallin J1 [Prolixibacteraceae bacterium]|jgi:ADP-ribosylglycohydrolase|nr:crystallin J1 [Prolixibacteraceae bacterium]
MIGAIIGDIVGSRFEFNNYRGTDFELFHPDSRFTDDTVCTMAVVDWIVNVNEWGPGSGAKFALVLQSWCKRYPMGDYGTMFRRWIENPIPYNSFGNGAAMRVSPVADYFTTIDHLLSGVEVVTAVSHNHPEGLKGAKAIAMAVWLARNGSGKEEIRKTVEEQFKYSLNLTCDQIRKTNQFNETCQVTVPQALVAFLESEDFESAIRLAVSIGGDSDTIAAITGSVAEAFYGVPKWMKEAAIERLPPEMSELVVEFYKKVSQ